MSAIIGSTRCSSKNVYLLRKSDFLIIIEIFDWEMVYFCTTPSCTKNIGAQLDVLKIIVREQKNTIFLVRWDVKYQYFMYMNHLYRTKRVREHTRTKFQNTTVYNSAYFLFWYISPETQKTTHFLVRQTDMYKK